MFCKLDLESKSITMKLTLLTLLVCQFNLTFSQDLKMKPLNELINTADPGWTLVEEWKKGAKNKIEVLERDLDRAEKALYRTQVTTRSPMGAIVYETGGILVDHGWIRILGSGSDKMKRSLPNWNKEKSFEDYGQAMPFILIADDAIGGFFALNGGGISQEDIGKVFYFAPDTLKWNSLGVGYSAFIHWTFTGDIDDFYSGLRWKDWKSEVEEMNTDQIMNFYPFLWTKYDNIEDLSRKPVPIQEAWDLNFAEAK